MSYDYDYGFMDSKTLPGLSTPIEPAISIPTPGRNGVAEAPEGIVFEAELTGFSDSNRVQVSWDFGDTYQFRYLPEDTKSNDRTSGMAIGHKAAHVYRTPGTYTVTCIARLIENGELIMRFASTQVTVVEFDPAITERIWISKTGDFTGKPAGYSEEDWSGGVPDTFTFQPNKAYYFEAGQVFDLRSIEWDFDLGGVLKVDRHGDGLNPVLNKIPDDAVTQLIWLRGNQQDNFYWGEVDLQSNYDPTANLDWESEPSAPINPHDGIRINLAENYAQRGLFFGCRFAGFSVGLLALGASVDSSILVVDSETTDWFDYGHFSGLPCEEGRIGCYDHQNDAITVLPDTANAARDWNTPGSLNTPRHGAGRWAYGHKKFLNRCVGFSYRSNWNGGGGAITQSVWRMGTSTATLPEIVGISECDAEGGFTVLSLNVQNDTTAQGPVGRFIVENVLLTVGADADTTAFISTSKPGAHFRNIIGHVPTGRGYGALLDRCALIEPYITSSYATNGETKVYSCTVVVDADEPTHLWRALAVIGDSSRPITYEPTNLIQMNGTFDSAASDLPFQNDNAPIEAAFPFAPQSGSPAYEAYTSGLIAALAFDGTPRAAPYSLGASEESTAPVSLFTTADGELYGNDLSLGQIIDDDSVEVARTSPSVSASFRFLNVPPGSYLVEFTLGPHSTEYVSDGNTRGRLFGNTTGGVQTFRLSNDGPSISLILEDVTGGEIALIPNGDGYSFLADDIVITAV